MVAITLHTHLPYVLHHGTWPHGSDWLCEAVAECYLPLLRMCDRLMDEGIRPGLTFDISPVLCEQIAHPDFVEVFRKYCSEHAELATGDASKFADDNNEDIGDLPEFWAKWYKERWREFDEVYNCDLLGAFRTLQDNDAIEIMTCGLTHGYFALLAEDSSIDLQVDMAIRSYEKYFGKRPRGIWLPECAYRPSYPWRTYLPVSAYAVARPRAGIEQILSRHGLEYFVSDQGALEGATPIGYEDGDGNRTAFEDTYGNARVQGEERSVFDLFRVGSTDHKESAVVFTRHRDIAMQVWSGDTGYPGDPDYLDFHKRYFRSAIRYWRVTDNKADMQFKQPYNPEWASNRAKEHADHFVGILEVSLQHRRGESDSPPTICLPFDTELFGHWWFEGPQFIERVIRSIHASDTLSSTTNSEQLDAVKPSSVIALPESSWGRNGNHEVWMNEDVEWTWEKEYRLEYRLRMLLEKHNAVEWDNTMRRIMINGLRQLVLAQASDWQFLISTFSSREYAEMRFHNHAADATNLFDLAERYAVATKITDKEIEFLETCEERDGIFKQEFESLFDEKKNDREE